MKISVIIPFYNLDHYVNECLDSVVAAVKKVEKRGGRRTDSFFVEIICVDDGSTDGTGTLLDEFAEKNAAGTPRLRVIHQSNGGEGAARNAGMAAATGDWITFLDGDDVWLENHLEVAVPALAQHSHADLVSFRFASFEDGTDLPKAEDAVQTDFGRSARDPRAQPAAETELDLRKTIPDAAILDIGVYPTFYRREFLQGASFSKLPLGADRLFVAQCLARANTVVMGSAVIHGYRLRANSMAHCAWSARKVMSQCDYAYGSLLALAASGKALGREGQSYLASLWLSDVPNRILRLRGEDRREAWTHWVATLLAGERLVMPKRYAVARKILLACPRQMLSLSFARFMRKCGII